MIPLSLTLSGFLSYKKQVELDFSGFDLACISGANGAGKSSLLDAITWALFGRARKGSGEETLINSASETATVTFEFAYERDHYRIQRSKTRGRTTLLELQLLDEQGSWLPLTEHSLRETEKRVESILRLDYDTFINTSFFLQGKADQFAQQPPGRRKDILGSILGLEVWENFRLAAAERRRSVEAERTGVAAWLGEVETELAQEQERNERLAAVRQDLEQKSALRRDKQTIVETFQRQAETLREKQKMTSLLEKQLQDWQAQQAANESQRLERQAELEQHQQVIEREPEIESAYQNLVRLRRELELCNTKADQFHAIEQQRLKQAGLISTEQTRLEQEMKGLQELQTRIEQFTGNLKGWEEQLAAQTDQISHLEKELARKAEQEKELVELQQALAHATSENKRLSDSMNELRGRIEELKSTKSSHCPLCSQPLTETHRQKMVNELQAEGKKMGDQYRDNQSAMRENEAAVVRLKKDLVAYQKVEQERQQLFQAQAKVQADVEQANREISRWQKDGQPVLLELQRKLAQLDFATEARKALAQAEQEAQILGYDVEKHAALRQEEVDARAAEENLRELERARSTLQPLKREIDGLVKTTQDLQARIAEQQKVLQQTQKLLQEEQQAMPDLAAQESELNLLRDEENQLLLELGRAEQLVSVLAEQKKRRQDLVDRREAMATLISQLEMLERAFGHNGVPALLIEQALPEIEARANLILDRLSNGSMSLRFETQRERKAGKKDEGAIQTLDILISDAVGVREYELFSGGEAFRINFAIRLALATALARRAGARLQTLVIDEGFGSQDEDGRQRLIEAINLVMQASPQTVGGEEAISDIRKILVITHLDELKDAFPARIEVEKTSEGSMLRVVA